MPVLLTAMLELLKSGLEMIEKGCSRGRFCKIYFMARQSLVIYITLEVCPNRRSANMTKATPKSIFILISGFIALSSTYATPRTPATKAKAKTQLKVSASQKKGGRSPASANDFSYDLTYRDIKLCGKTYSFPEIISQNPDLHLIFEDQTLPQTQIRLNLPSKIRGASNGNNQTLYKSGPTEAPPHDLLLILPITSNDPLLQKIYCDRLTEIKKYFAQKKNSPAISQLKTELIELKQFSGRGKKAKTSHQIGFDLKNQYELKAPAPVPPAAIARINPGTTPAPISTQVVHVVIATKDYVNEAQALSESRIQAGLGSRAISLERIPGIQPGDPIPAQCRGLYYNECYVTPTTVPYGITFASTTSLAGMRSWNDMDSPAYRRIGDAAGLVRAYLRSLKLEHPELKYVVLMGDLFQLPPRYTDNLAYSTGPAEAPNFDSTDYYYADLFSVWRISNATNYSGISPLGWPCGDECTQPNTNWDTRAFRWPAAFPFARTMQDPIRQQPNNSAQFTQGMNNMVSVGRIISKPAVGQTRDAAVAKYVEKLDRWDAHPGERSQVTIVSSDGVYVRRNLQEFEAKLGNFRFFGEGFGTAFVTSANRPSDYSTVDCIHQPPSNDWHSYPLTTSYNGDELYLYQSEPKHCAPVDPSANWTRLPNPAEVTQEISRTGFTFFFNSAHAGYAGINYQSDGNGGSDGRSFRNFNTRVNNGGHYTIASPPGFEDLANYREHNGRANGFMISSGCSPSSYFGGLQDKPMFPNNGRSMGEYMVMMENAGAVGTFMNTDVGYFYSDPLFEMDMIQSMKQVGDTLSTPRFGDVTINLYRNVVPQNIHTYQILNRVFIGDPSAKLFRKDPVIIDSMPNLQNRETP